MSALYGADSAADVKVEPPPLSPETIEALRTYRYLFLVVPGIIILTIVGIAWLPNSIIANVKPLRQAKKKILKTWKRGVELTLQGPVYTISVWCGKTFGAGYMSSLPRAPTHVKAETQSFNEVFFWWKPNYPRFNPFHEEHYQASWQLIDPQEGEDKNWHTKEFFQGNWEEDGKKFKLGVDALPEGKKIRFRICAVNKKGRGEHSKTCEATTFSRPDKDGGFWGPLGPASRHLAEDRRKYTWTQMRGEIAVKVPLHADWKRDNISFDKTPARLIVAYLDEKGNKEVLLKGAFPQRAKIDEIFWQIEETKEDGRHMIITMVKEDPLQQWSHVFEGEEHPSIDKKYVRLLTDGMDDNIDWLKENVPKGQPRAHLQDKENK